MWEVYWTVWKQIFTELQEFFANMQPSGTSAIIKWSAAEPAYTYAEMELHGETLDVNYTEFWDAKSVRD